MVGGALVETQEKNIYIGCGPDIREGFLHSDIRDFDHVDYVCKAWELSKHAMEVNHIYTRHMLEHLTNYEADRALRDWFKALRTFGTVRIVVPDADFHCRQWLEADWTEETLKAEKSDAKHGFAGLWGWQSECDPWSENYNTTYWDVHKSGYNQKRMRLLLERIGFVNVKTEVKNRCHLVAEATKPVYSGERQVGTSLETIRQDHVNRYRFASNLIRQKNAIITDAACGVGYGSYILAQNENVHSIQALDISNDALGHAKQHFDNVKTEFIRADLENESLERFQQADYFVSFETIEHLPSPEKFLAKISACLKPGGTFIGSTPNEEIMPFIQQNFLFHTRHFTEADLEDILTDNGFSSIEFFQQKREAPSSITKSNDGNYIIFVAKKQ